MDDFYERPGSFRILSKKILEDNCGCTNPYCIIRCREFDHDRCLGLGYHGKRVLELRLMNTDLAMFFFDNYLASTFNPNSIKSSRSPYSSPTPLELFPETPWGRSGPRFLMDCERPTGPKRSVIKQLIYTDGACLNNGSVNAKGGIGVVVSSFRCISRPLSCETSDGARVRATSNRAELQAVIDALQCSDWYNDGPEALVIATDSTYVAEGATNWVASWALNGWDKSDGHPVANADLWKSLLALFKLYALHGCEVSIWRIPREWNDAADQLAKKGASCDEDAREANPPHPGDEARYSNTTW
ncbi:ribonuclease H-like domain-containing protein [Hypomontagnella submonticulosa]|nr:ribonuclease H-like domain-containing protein [Hypomontagnella submonticulosa]